MNLLALAGTKLLIHVHFHLVFIPILGYLNTNSDDDMMMTIRTVESITLSPMRKLQMRGILNSLSLQGFFLGNYDAND